MDDLKALGAKRWLDRTGSWERAFSQTFEVIRKTRGKGWKRTRIGLYSDREEVWNRAKKRAEAIIATWEREYAPNQVD